MHSPTHHVSKVEAHEGVLGEGEAAAHGDADAVEAVVLETGAAAAAKSPLTKKSGLQLPWYVYAKPEGALDKKIIRTVTLRIRVTMDMKTKAFLWRFIYAVTSGC